MIYFPSFLRRAFLASSLLGASTTALEAQKFTTRDPEKVPVEEIYLGDGICNIEAEEVNGLAVDAHIVTMLDISGTMIVDGKIVPALQAMAQAVVSDEMMAIYDSNQANSAIAFSFGMFSEDDRGFQTGNTFIVQDPQDALAIKDYLLDVVVKNIHEVAAPVKVLTNYATALRAGYGIAKDCFQDLVANEGSNFPAMVYLNIVGDYDWALDAGRQTKEYRNAMEYLTRDIDFTTSAIIYRLPEYLQDTREGKAREFVTFGSNKFVLHEKNDLTRTFIKKFTLEVADALAHKDHALRFE